MALIGYARVSTLDQDLSIQTASLKEVGCEKVYSEKVTGSKLENRKELAKAIKELNEGDVLIVTRLDRLARNSRDLHNTIHALTEKGVGFRSIKEAIMDTTTPIGKAVVGILAVVAELERSTILDRTQEGRRRAMKNGVKFGPKFKLTPERKAQVRRMLNEGMTQREVALIAGVSQPTVMRAARD